MPLVEEDERDSFESNILTVVMNLVVRLAFPYLIMIQLTDTLAI